MEWKKTRWTLVGTGLAVAVVGAVWMGRAGQAVQSSQSIQSGSSVSGVGVRVEEVDGQRRYSNRLIHEKSPYLLQHADNPVDWFPWGEDAFEKARRDGKPIFLSVGYSTCHWCYVMESQSFANPAIAAIMYEHFVSVKLDREERPDVDRVYMSFVQATTGGGGWPMSVFLTPDLKPFFGGTYFPPDAFRSLLQQVRDVWTAQRDEIVQSAEKAPDFYKRRSARAPRLPPRNWGCRYSIRPTSRSRAATTRSSAASDRRLNFPVP